MGQSDIAKLDGEMLHWHFAVEQQQPHKYQLGFQNNHSGLMPVSSQ